VLLGLKLADHIDQRGVDQNQVWKSDMLAFMNLRFQGK
jgi:hypothetical protein